MHCLRLWRPQVATIWTHQNSIPAQEQNASENYFSVSLSKGVISTSYLQQPFYCYLQNAEPIPPNCIIHHPIPHIHSKTSSIKPRICSSFKSMLQLCYAHIHSSVVCFLTVVCSLLKEISRCSYLDTLAVYTFTVIILSS
jgi:hypothetical protein